MPATKPSPAGKIPVYSTKPPAKLAMKEEDYKRYILLAKAAYKANEGARISVCPAIDPGGIRSAPEDARTSVLSKIQDDVKQIFPGAVVKHFKPVMTSCQTVPAEDDHEGKNLDYTPVGFTLSVSMTPERVEGQAPPSVPEPLVQNFAAFRGTMVKETFTDLTASVQLGTFLANLGFVDVSEFMPGFSGKMRASVWKFHLRSSKDKLCVTQRDEMRQELNAMPSGPLVCIGHSWGAEQALVFAMEAALMMLADGTPKFPDIHVVQFAGYFSGDLELTKSLAKNRIRFSSFLFEWDPVRIMVNPLGYIAYLVRLALGLEKNLIEGKSDGSVPAGTTWSQSGPQPNIQKSGENHKIESYENAPIKDWHENLKLESIHNPETTPTFLQEVEEESSDV